MKRVMEDVEYTSILPQEDTPRRYAATPRVTNVVMYLAPRGQIGYDRTTPLTSMPLATPVRHRSSSRSPAPMTYLPALKDTDPEIRDLIIAEEKREWDKIRLIPSENYASTAVLEASGSVLTNKYSEGYPGKRYYEGQQITDIVETLAIERAKKLFGVEHANVQPYSGSPANMAVYQGVLQGGDGFGLVGPRQVARAVGFVPGLDGRAHAAVELGESVDGEKGENESEIGRAHV